MLILQENQRVPQLLSGLLNFVNCDGGCGVEYVTEDAADYRQSIFCHRSPMAEQTGIASRNHSELLRGIETLLDRNNPAEAQVVLTHLEEDTAVALEDIPVSLWKDEREKLLRNEVADE